MEAFLVMLIKPFVTVPFFLAAHAGKKLAQRLPDGRLKRFLLISWKT